MENHHIDSIIRKAIRESADFYNQDADRSKEKIWNRVRLNKQRQPSRVMLRLLAAACVLLFISLTIAIVSNVRTNEQIKALADINEILKDQAATKNTEALNRREPLVDVNSVVPDTVFIEKKVFVDKPVIVTKRMVDTVYVKQKVYVERELAPELLTAIKTGLPTDTSSRVIANNYEAEVLIRGSEPSRKKKGKRIQIRFGGNIEQTNSGTLALTTEL